MKPLIDLSLDEWGATAMEFARRDPMRIALEATARKSAYQAPARTNLGRFAPRIVPDEVFITSSGIAAYRHRVSNKNAMGTVSTAPVDLVEVSLPYVSIQHEGRGR